MVPRLATDAELREHEAVITRDRADWQQLLLASTLGASARLVGLVIAIHAGHDGQHAAWLSQADLARSTGLSVHQIRYHLDALEHSRWIHRPAGPGGAWYLGWPEPAL